MTSQTFVKHDASDGRRSPIPNNSEGCQGRCDAKCYEAAEEECDCICGGRNDGAGQEQAVENTRELAESWLEQARANGQDITAVPFPCRTTWSLPDTYHLAGHGRGTATFKFYEGRDILRASGPGVTAAPWECPLAVSGSRLCAQRRRRR